MINSVSYSAKFHDLLVYFFTAPHEEREHVSTRRFVAITKRHDATNLTKAKPRRLAGSNETQSFDHVRLIFSVSRRQATWFIEHANTFVVTDRLHCDSGAPGDFSYVHIRMVALDSPLEGRP